jgi:hypothetical protein
VDKRDLEQAETGQQADGKEYEKPPHGGKKLVSQHAQERGIDFTADADPNPTPRSSTVTLRHR